LSKHDQTRATCAANIGFSLRTGSGQKGLNSFGKWCRFAAVPVFGLLLSSFSGALSTNVSRNSGTSGLDETRHHEQGKKTICLSLSLSFLESTSRIQSRLVCCCYHYPSLSLSLSVTLTSLPVCSHFFGTSGAKRPTLPRSL
jgi:hypothetical protein